MVMLPRMQNHCKAGANLNNRPMPDTSDSALLPAVGLLERLTPEQRDRLQTFGEVFSLKKGDHLIEQGQPQGYMHVVLKGELKVHVASKEAVVPLGYVEAGGCVGEMSLLEPSIASATVTASAPSEVWSLTRERFDAFLADHPAPGAELLRGIALTLADRLRKGSERLLASEG
jgi:CRP-like cAMP-binding protein